MRSYYEGREDIPTLYDLDLVAENVLSSALLATIFPSTMLAISRDPDQNIRHRFVLGKSRAVNAR